MPRESGASSIPEASRISTNASGILDRPIQRPAEALAKAASRDGRFGQREPSCGRNETSGKFTACSSAAGADSHRPGDRGAGACTSDAKHTPGVVGGCDTAGGGHQPTSARAVRGQPGGRGTRS